MALFAATLSYVSSKPASPELDRLEVAHLALRADVRRFIARRVEPSVADDLVQEVFLKMYENAGGLRNVESIAPWLFRIARNVVIDHLRKRRGRVHTPLEEADEPTTIDPEVNYNEEMAAWFRP